MIFETHAHYDDEAFDEDRDELIPGLYEKGIEKIVNISVNRKTCEDTLGLIEKYPFFYGALGFHPSECADFNEAEYQWIKEAAEHERVVAIGEIGLDYHWPEPERELQKRVFKEQLRLARETGLPIVVHSRDAAKDTMDILKEHGAGLSGVVHCYSYHAQDALEYVRLGFNIGIGGVITFKNAHKLREVAEAVPLESIVIETDCPYLAPEPYRGKRNCSLYLTYVIDKLAEIKGITSEEAEQATWQNAMRMYNLI